MYNVNVIVKSYLWLLRRTGTKPRVCVRIWSMMKVAFPRRALWEEGRNEGVKKSCQETRGSGKRGKSLSLVHTHFIHTEISYRLLI